MIFAGLLVAAAVAASFILKHRPPGDAMPVPTTGGPSHGPLPSLPAPPSEGTNEGAGRGGGKRFRPSHCPPGDPLCGDLDPPEPRPPEHPTGDRLAAVDQALEAMKQANIAFNTPSRVRLSETALVHLVMSQKESKEALAAAVSAPGERESARISVSKRMEAKLEGDEKFLKVKPITPEEQAVSESEITEWKWSVTPIGEGQGSLHLSLTAFLEVDGTSTRRALRTYDKTIAVEVLWWERLAGFSTRNWQWLWATLVAPLAAWLWQRRKKSKSEPPASLGGAHDVEARERA